MLKSKNAFKLFDIINISPSLVYVLYTLKLEPEQYKKKKKNVFPRMHNVSKRIRINDLKKLNACFSPKKSKKAKLKKNIRLYS